MKLKSKKIFISIICILVILNISWFLITSIKYKKFIDAVPKDEHGVYALYKDGYSYGVKKPNYLQYTGNLSIVNNETGYNLIIWPLLLGEYEYGLIIVDNEMGYEIYVDENMKLIDNDNLFYSQLIEENQVAIEEIFSKANEMWNLKK